MSDALTKREFAANVLFVFAFFYICAFNFLPSTLLTIFAAGLFLGFSILTADAVFRTAGWQEGATSIAIVVVGLCWAIGYASVFSVFNLTEALRTIQPLILLAFVGAASNLVSHKVVHLSALATVIFAAMVAILSPEIYYARSYRIAPFTGGEGTIHPSGYVVFLCGVILLHAASTARRARGIYFLGALTALIMLMGYAHRTAIIMSVVFALGVLASAFGRITKQKLVFAALFLLVSAFSTLLLAASIGSALPEFGQISGLSSGRLEVWVLRFENIWSRDLQSFLFGAGPGSDLGRFGPWRHEDRNSHNDFVTTLFESGLIGLTMLILILWIVWTNLSVPARVVFLPMVVASALSNGLLGRPAMFLVFAAALCIYQSTGASSLDWRKCTKKADRTSGVAKEL